MFLKNKLPDAIKFFKNPHIFDQSSFLAKRVCFLAGFWWHPARLDIWSFFGASGGVAETMAEARSGGSVLSSQRHPQATWGHGAVCGPLWHLACTAACAIGRKASILGFGSGKGVGGVANGGVKWGASKVNGHRSPLKLRTT